MSAHLSRLRLFQRHLRSLGWVWVWVWDWVHTSPHTFLSFSPPSFHTISLSRSLVRDGQTSPHKPRLVVPFSTCPSLSPSPPAHSFIIGPPVINKHTHPTVPDTSLQPQPSGGCHWVWLVAPDPPPPRCTMILCLRNADLCSRCTVILCSI